MAHFDRTRRYDVKDFGAFGKLAGCARRDLELVVRQSSYTVGNSLSAAKDRVKRHRPARRHLPFKRRQFGALRRGLGGRLPGGGRRRSCFAAA